MGIDWEIVVVATAFIVAAMAAVALAIAWALYRRADAGRMRRAAAASRLLDAATEDSAGNVRIPAEAWAEFSYANWGRWRLPRRIPGKWNGRNRITRYIHDPYSSEA